MLEFVFGVVIGILLAILYVQMEINGNLAAEDMILTAFGWTLHVKKEESSGQGHQKSRLSSSKSKKSGDHSGHHKSRLSSSKIKKLREDDQDGQKQRRLSSSTAKEFSEKLNDQDGQQNTPKSESQGVKTAATPTHSERVQANLKQDHLSQSSEEDPKSPSKQRRVKTARESTPSMYLSPSMLKGGSGRLDVKEGELSSDNKQASGGQSKGAIRDNQSLYLAPTMNKSEESGREEPKQNNKNASVGQSKGANREAPSLYLSPDMTKGRSGRFGLDESKARQ